MEIENNIKDKLDNNPDINLRNIAKEIISALDRTVDIDPDEITVKVEGGKVLMSGTVPNRAARQLAYEAAWFTPGVTKVEDRLSVSELTHCHC